MKTMRLFFIIWILMVVVLAGCGSAAPAMAATHVFGDVIVKGPWVDVRAYGAKGDGVTDDTVAFLLAGASGRPVMVPEPPVAYLLRNFIPPNGSRYYGQNWPKITTDVAYGAIQFNGGKYDVAIEGLEFISSSYATPDRSGVEIAGATGNYNISVTKCRFHDISNGIRVNGSPNNPSYLNKLSDNEMWDVGIGISMLGLVDSDVTLNRIQYRSYLYRGILATNASRCNISKNIIIGNISSTVTGILLLYNNPVVTGYQQSNSNNISGNTIRGIMEEGISLDYYASSHMWEGTATAGTSGAITETGAGWTTNEYIGYYVVITSGTGAGEYRYITSNTSDTISVSNYFNVVPDSTSKFIVAAPFLRNKITGNTVSNTGREGISIWGTAIGNIIQGNSLQAAGGVSTSTPSIRVQGYNYTSNPDMGAAFHNSILGNTVENNGNLGILVSNYSDTTPGFAALGNVVNGNYIGGSGVGVKLDYASYGQVKNNTIVNATTAVLVTANLTTDNSITGNNPIACQIPYNIAQAQGNVEIDAAAMPTTGTLSRGTFVRNIAPTLMGSGGYATANQKYTIKGWIKLNTGSTNVLNTDWVEERVLTGQ